MEMEGGADCIICSLMKCKFIFELACGVSVNVIMHRQCIKSFMAFTSDKRTGSTNCHPRKSGDPVHANVSGWNDQFVK